MKPWINQFLENEIVNRTDKTDTPINEGPLSVLSVRTPVLLDEKLVNMPEPNISDKPDRLDPSLNLSGLSGRPQGVLERTSYPYADHDFEERLAIVEYDGLQTSSQAERIAYLDAVLALLATLPYEDVEGDWLAHRIKAAQEWLLDQGIEQAR